MHFGAPLTPAHAGDSLAWHRARAFSHYANETGLSPQSMFELMEALGLDMHDGALDGHAGGDPISLVQGSGATYHMPDHDHALRYAQARAGMLHHDLQTVFNGNGSTEVANNLPEFQYLPVIADEDGDSQNAAASYTLRAVQNVDVTVQAPGTSWTTPMLRYNGMQLPPVIRARRGDEMFLTLVNQLADDTTIHWHGFKVPGPEDGGPTDPVAPNSTRVYNFTLDQSAASLWFHPHPHGQTAEQVYRGLAGVFVLTDDIDDQLRSANQVPAIEHDIPVLVQDRLFEAEVSGERLLTYSADHMSGLGMMGGTTLINGAELPRLSVETRQYTLRLYNASNSRTYDFALHDGRPFHIVGSDGGWLAEPALVNHVVLSPGERAAIVIDFGADQVGDRVMLLSRPFMVGPAWEVEWAAAAIMAVRMARATPGCPAKVSTSCDSMSTSQ
jgi:FtsP/CotA-like multicopper oxidase with cupredoxin domain